MDINSDKAGSAISSPSPDNQSSSCCVGQKRQVFIGCVIVILLTFSWAGAQQFAQSAIQLDGFNAPYFTSWMSTCWMILCFPFYCLFVVLKYRNFDEIKDEIWNSSCIFGTPRITARQFFLRIVPMNILWIFTNYVYLFGLKFIAVTDASAVFASNVAFVYMLSVCLLKERLYIIRVLACIFCISGVVLFAYSYGFSGGTQLLAGALMVVAGAFGAALYKVVFKLWVREAMLGQVSSFLSLLGLSNVLFLWIIFLILYLTGVEHFEWTDVPWTYLTIAIVLALVFNFTLNFGVAYTYPLFISIAMMLGIPLNAAFDVLLKGVTFNATRLFAVFAVILGFCIMLLPDHLNKPIHRVLLCRLQRTNEAIFNEFDNGNEEPVKSQTDEERERLIS